MPDLGLGTGERRLLAAVARLREVDPGPREPAPLFRALTSTGPASAWQGLEAAVAGSGFDPSDSAALAPPPASHDPSGRSVDRPGPDRRAKPDPWSARAPDAGPDQDRAIPPPPEGAAALTVAVTRGDLDPAEIVEDLLARIAALDPSLNAFVTVTPERARRVAHTLGELLERGEIPPPLAGVPLAHKDIVLTGGIRTTAGSALLAEYVPGEDAAAAAGLARAGTLLTGKSNTHEFATGPTGTVSVHGPTRNPWDRSRMAGGSSAGSAAALAAGMAVLATGSDTGGSIRIPAACCGITGLKPTYDRIDRDGVVPFAWSLDHVGPMARSVEDVALQLAAMLGGGVDRSHRSLRDDGPPSPGDGDLTDLDGFRFAVVEPFQEASRPEVAAAVEGAAGVMAELGAVRATLDPLPELDLVAPAAVAIFLAEGGAVHDRLLARFPGGYQEETRAFLELAPRVDSVAYVQAQRVRNLLMHAVAGAMAELDLLVCPTLPVTAPPLDARTVFLPEGETDVRAALTRFTRPFNLTGQPALSLPCGFVDGLPVGLQLVGRPHGDELVLAAGRAYQEATDWHRRRPPGYGPAPTIPGG